MKQALIIIGIFAFSFAVKAQEEEKVYSKKELRAIAREEKKAQKLAEEEQMRVLTEIMLKEQRFVLEANYVGDAKGSRIPVQSNLNFIGVDTTNATIQLGTVYGVGYNGVGGITVDGRITKYDLQVVEGKRSKSYNLMMVVMTSLGIYDITLMVSETGYTDATIRANTAGQLKYSGNLVPIGLSRVYKGTTLY